MLQWQWLKEAMLSLIDSLESEEELQRPNWRRLEIAHHHRSRERGDKGNPKGT